MSLTVDGAVFSWARAVWKGLRPALLVAAVAAIAAFLGAIDVKVLVDLGVPQVLAVFILEMARNWAKQHGWLAR